ncbi:MAG: DUF5977 domain-containing protein, partial [Bacteroidales bacterium]|nr:DUF5977 domain-containing protein [Bacteroidales bacterium]
MATDDWTSKEKLREFANKSMIVSFDMEPDEFVINAYGVSGSVYFDRDEDGNLQSHVKSNNGESFRVDFPVMKHNPGEITFRGGPGEPLKAYRIYELFYEFTVTKNDGTRLIFGGDDDCIEFYTEKYPHGNSPYLKTWPSAWMLREVISPDGMRMTFEYQRNGSPIILSDVITDICTYFPDGQQAVWPSQSPDRGISFIVKHPVYPKSIRVDDLTVDFSYNHANDLSTIGSRFVYYMQTKGFSNNIVDHVCYENGSIGDIAYAPHNYSEALARIQVSRGTDVLHSFGFAYTTGRNERLKLTILAIRGKNGIAEQKYGFTYNPLKLPEYNSPVTDNWGYWNNKDYRSIGIEDGFFEYRSANEYYTKAEVLTRISYPTGGTASFDYELNDYSKVATQVPDFKILEQDGTAGGLRIKRISYSTGSRTYTHSFEYKNEDGKSSGILSGIPVYVAEGRNYVDYDYASWESLVYFHDKAQFTQSYRMLSETYINTLGLTTGNYVTYSRVVESIADENPLVKEYRYTNHDSCPDTSDFKMYTNYDSLSLINKFTSHALMRGLITDEIWYSDGNIVKETKFRYNSNPARMDNFVRSIEIFSIPGMPGYLIRVPFVRFTPYKILTFYPYLESKVEKEYDPSGSTLISMLEEHYSYNGNLMPVSTVRNTSEGGEEKTAVTYPDNYPSIAIYSEMDRRGMVSSPVETVTYRDGKAVSGQLVEYSLMNSLVVPYRQWQLGLTSGIDSTSFRQYTGSSMDSRYEIAQEILEVDSSGNPLLVKPSDGMPVSCQWGYDSSYPVAVVSNAANTYTESGEPERREFLYESFESFTDKGTYPFGYQSNKCFVGSYPIYMSGNVDNKYILDYRVYRNGKWNYVTKMMQDSSYVINEGLNPIDDVRVRPESSGIETYSWYPYIGLRSRTGEGGITESYIYDVCGRLQAVRDDSGDVISQYDYNYAGNSPQIYSPYYTNQQMSMTFVNSDCSEPGYIPIPVEYTVPAHTYRSSESVEDANRMAFDDILSNGQNYADEHGVCGPYIKVTVYNPSGQELLLRYAYMGPVWVEYADYTIPPGQRVDYTGDTVKDYLPIEIYVMRRTYSSALIYNS